MSFARTQNLTNNEKRILQTLLTGDKFSPEELSKKSGLNIETSMQSASLLAENGLCDIQETALEKIMEESNVCYSKDEINGMLIILNKIYWKIPIKYAEYLLAEAADIPELNGRFFRLNDEIVFRNDKEASSCSNGTMI
jgi:hypothetical protein